MIAHKATLHSPFCELVGLQFLEESPGACRCKLAVRDELCNPFKRMHGGALFTLADTAMGVALYHTLDEGQRCATQEIQIRYLQGAREGEVICNARLTGVSNGIAHLEAEIESRSGLIAKAAGTFFVYTPGGVRPAPAGGEDTWPRVPQRIRAEV